MVLNPHGRNWGLLVNWDSLGQAYAGFIIAWTILLYAGVACLIRYRDLPFVRIRNVPLAITSVSFLHLYLTKILLAYTTNGNFSCGAEFWIMSVYLPFGIALFQANLAQLQSISDQQQRLLPLAKHLSISTTDSAKSARDVWKLWRQLPQIQKTYTYIGIGMLIQLIITAFLYATTPELRGDWTSYGRVSFAKGQALCRKQPQFIPSAIWQLLWSWFYGLYTLIKTRNIHDTHYWRLGTWLSILAGLPGTPLWLAALYSKKFHPVNIWWVPPMWLAPGIVVMQTVTILFPVYEAYDSHLRWRGRMSIAEVWQGVDAETAAAKPSANEPNEALRNLITTCGKEIFSMASLEKALAVNPQPLLQFAATKDFTAENIIFLMRVREYRRSCSTAPRKLGKDQLTDHGRASLFRMAVKIYMACVDENIAEFPINIPGSIRTKLKAIFEPVLPEPRDRSSAEWNNKLESLDNLLYQARTSSPVPEAEVRRIIPTRMASDDSEQTLLGEKETMVSTKTMDSTCSDDDSTKTVSPAVESQVRPVLGADVFDEAEASIKYLVLTNTWRRFVIYAGKSFPEMNHV